MYTPLCIHMGWLQVVGSLTYRSLMQYRLFCRALLQQRPIILRSLLIVATPYLRHTPAYTPHMPHPCPRTTYATPLPTHHICHTPAYTPHMPHPYLHTYATPLPTCMYVCMYGSLYVCMYVWLHVPYIPMPYPCLRRYVCMYVCLHVCMYVCMAPCMYVCMYGSMYPTYLCHTPAYVPDTLQIARRYSAWIVGFRV